ncbi:unnamed protein product [Leptidea sinapis]|uniref:Uncharacterized protein n=1 Tax=Leptidea sinapis TaxID=189913 RepID=A0A5E4QZD2_9NEOP|nr:unnamed protein product [Leptidea sinapis]
MTSAPRECLRWTHRRVFYVEDLMEGSRCCGGVAFFKKCQ